jgi:hypothetical protein
LRRHVAELPPTVEPARHGPFSECDTEIIARLSATSEDAALAFFWMMNAKVDDRLGLLFVLGQVVINRPASWDRAVVRRDHLAAWADHASLPACYGCGSHEKVYLHHIIGVQHGGSNGRRNQVALCFRCHQYLHPWLTDQRTASSDFESLASIFGRARLPK